MVDVINSVHLSAALVKKLSEPHVKLHSFAKAFYRSIINITAGVGVHVC